MKNLVHIHFQLQQLCGDLWLLRDILVGIWRAWRVRNLIWRRGVSAMLTPVAPTLYAPTIDPQQVLRRVDQIVRLAAWWKFDKRCFYRAFTAAFVLRRRAISARLNFGLRLANNRRQQCHCWVTVDSQPLGEETDPQARFPVAVGQWGDGLIYWLADGDQGELCNSSSTFRGSHNE